MTENQFTAGYSPSPIGRKIGIKEDMAVFLINPPAGYSDALAEYAAADIRLADDAKSVPAEADLVHLFTAERAILADALAVLRETIAQDGMIWASWPKKASKVATDITEDTIREVALPLGLVDVKVCAVDTIWSGLKLVIRKELRR